MRQRTGLTPLSTIPLRTVSALAALTLSLLAASGRASADFAGDRQDGASWQSTDIGSTLPGKTAVAGEGVTVSGGGADIEDTSDGFRFVYQPMRGDIVLTARVEKQTGSAPWAKAGIMIREGLDAGAKNVFLAITPGHGLIFQQRASAGEPTQTQDIPGASAPAWLQVRRVGSVISAFRSDDGTRWTPVGSPVMVSMKATVDAGLATTSHDSATLSDAVFDHVGLKTEAPQAPDARGLTFTVTAVDPGVFHIVAYRTGNPPPPVSPFVVETTPLGSSAVRDGSASVKTDAGTFDLQPGGHVHLRGKGGRDIIPTGTIGVLDNAITFSLAHGAQERFYGAGNASENHAGDLTHPSSTQAIGNGVTRVPFLWSTGGWSAFVANNQNGSAWNNENNTLTWTVPGPCLDLYLSVAPDGYGLLDAYSRLTGRAPIPPKWTFGFMQSRWGYADAADVQDKWHQFRDRKIPVDAFIYDYDWFVNDFTFNPMTFPAGSLDTMKEMGLKFVGIRKPRITGANLDYARSQGWVLSSPLGTDLRFDLPVARYWWWDQHIPLVNAGVAGWWNDEAEQTIDEFFQQSQTEWDGWRAVSDKRAWEINRAFAPGIQRFGAATWTGDINTDWETLANQPGTMLNWSLAGMPYVGQDIGGFQGTPGPELYTRWIEEGVFVPVMRAHGGFNSPRWPWAFGDDAQAAMKKAIELRHRLIPYYYSFAAQTTATAAPLMRPLFLEFPQDSKTFNLEDEWLVGNRLLAAPVLAPGGSRSVYLPAGGWFDFNTSAAVAGGQTFQVTAPLDAIPAYVRAGTILPLGPILQSTSLGVEDPLEVRIYPGADADFTLYEDDGDTYAYEKGQASRIPMHWDDKERRLTVDKRAGQFPGMLKVRHLDVLLPDGSRKSVVYDGGRVEVGF